MRPTRDHVLPKSQGFIFTQRNKVICCSRCNVDKGNLSLWDWCRVLVVRNDWRSSTVQRFVDTLDLDDLLEENEMVKAKVAEEKQRNQERINERDRRAQASQAMSTGGEGRQLDLASGSSGSDNGD